MSSVYEKYSPSGIEWLPLIPSDWETVRLRWLATIYSGGTPDKKNESYWTGGTVPWLNSGAVNQQLVTEPSTYITEEALENSSAKWVPEDALVIALAGQGKTKGMVAQLAFNATCNQSMAAIIPDSKLKARFLYWWLTSNYQNIRNLAGGDLRDGLNLQLLGKIGCPIPSRQEQKAISSFLDVETSKIDGLVSEQRRLIELLKEKRQAVISHAVTKGLNPNAPMKPSGIQWLGEVPKHWEVKRLRHVGQVQNGLNIGGEAFGSGDPFVSYGDVYKNVNVPEVPSGLVQSSPEDKAKCSLEAGDVLFTRTSETVEDIGVASTCLCSIPRSTFAGFLIRLRPDDGILSPQYSTYLFRNQGVQEHFSGTMNMVTRASLSQDVLKMLPICIPPLREQQEIAEFITEKVDLFHSLIGEVERGIELLQERRTALISAAVTGKIDVREFAYQETA